MNKKTILAVIVILILLISIPLTIYISGQSQDTRSRAEEPNAPLAVPTVFDTPTPAPTTAACNAPAQVENVQIEFPYCEGASQVGDACDFHKASCTWDAVTDAVNYSVKVTEVDSNTVVSTQTIAAPNLKVSFPVTVNKTYQCDVSAVNACGASGAAGSNSLLCAVDVPESPTPTPVPTTPTPTPVPVVATVPPTPAPTIPPTGSVGTTAMVGVGSVILIILGGLAFLF